MAWRMGWDGMDGKGSWPCLLVEGRKVGGGRWLVGGREGYACTILSQISGTGWGWDMDMGVCCVEG